MVLVHIRSTVVVFFLFRNMKRKLSPPGGKKYLGTIKASTSMILVHVQKMYNIFKILIGVPDYSSSFFVFQKMKRKPTKRNTRMILLHVHKMYKTSTEDVQYI